MGQKFITGKTTREFHRIVTSSGNYISMDSSSLGYYYRDSSCVMKVDRSVYVMSKELFRTNREDWIKWINSRPFRCAQ